MAFSATAAEDNPSNDPDSWEHFRHQKIQKAVDFVDNNIDVHLFTALLNTEPVDRRASKFIRSPFPALYLSMRVLVYPGPHGPWLARPQMHAYRHRQADIHTDRQPARHS